MARTLFEKIWDAHVVATSRGEPALLYIDLHLVHEVTSPQAFDGAAARGPQRAPARPHGRDDGSQRADASRRGRSPTRSREAQLDALAANCAEFGIRSTRPVAGAQGIVHVIGPSSG